MKLLACHIDNFGKLSDFSMDFSEGMNLILEENGWGKTTLAAFLKVMFYGCDPRKEPGAYEKERHIYQPWQGGVYGGTLDFEVDGREYRISRTFGRTEKTDTFHLYDLETMLESRDFTSNIGVELFDLDSASFKRSIFIGQNDCTCTSTDGIHAKLGNLVENTNDINNYESACAKLKDAINHLSPTRATGSIRRRRQQIERLEMEVKSLDAAKEGYTRLSGLQQEQFDRKEQLLAARKQYARELEQVSKEGADYEKRMQYESLLAEEQQQQAVLKSYQELFPKGVPEEEDLRKLTGTVRQMAETNAEIRNLQTDEENTQEFEKMQALHPDGLPTKEEVGVYIEKQHTLASIKERLILERQKALDLQEQIEENPLPDEESVKIGPAVGNILGIVFVVLALLGLAASLVISRIYEDFSYAGYMPAVGLILAGVLCLIATLLFTLGKKQKTKKENRADELRKELAQKRTEQEAPLTELKEQIAADEQQMTEMEQEIREFLEQNHKEAKPDRFIPVLYELSNEVERYERFGRSKMALSEARLNQQNLQEQVNAFADQYQLTIEGDVAGALTDIQTKVAEYRMAQQAFERAEWKRQQFETQNDMSQIMAQSLDGRTLESVNEAIRDTDEQLDRVREAVEQYNRQIEELQQQMDLRSEREEELRSLQETQEEQQHRYEIMELTQEYLQKAKERFTSKYRAPIADGFSKYYHMLLESASDDWQIDANMQFSMRESGQMRLPRELSRGWQDLIGVCMRLALADAMYQGEKPFLILDDPFVNLDQEKVETARRMIASVACEYQVIYFTCHPSRIPEGAAS